MVPSSTIWTLHNPANILVYPMSWYEMTTSKKSRANRRTAERARWTATGRRYHSAGDSGHGSRANASDVISRRHHQHRRRRRRRRRPRRRRGCGRRQRNQLQRRPDEERDEASPCPPSSSSSSSSSPPSTSASSGVRRQSSPSSRGRSTSDDGPLQRVTCARHAIGPEPHGAAHRRGQHRRNRCRHPRRLRENITSRPSLRHRGSGDDSGGGYGGGGGDGVGGGGDGGGGVGGGGDGAVDPSRSGARQSSADRARAGPAVRCSANVVLLAHGNRSLHVLVIQRSQTRYFHVNRITTAASVVRYKLPGGKFVMTDEELEKYLHEDRSVCCCPDDERWYSGALEHFLTTRSPTKPSPLSRSSSSSTTTTTTTTTSRTSCDSPPPRAHVHRGMDAAPATPGGRLFVPLGKWYRTQDKEARERDGSCNAAAVRNAIARGGGGQSPSHCWHYYPYKPAHVSRQAAEEKRLYGVPDARCLFGGGGGERQTFRVPTPRAKVKTVTRPDGSIVYTATTYKCKFVPLARLHENNRTYGPILSSLPVVVSSMNLIYLP